MPYSSPEGKAQAVEFVRDLNPATVLDVGAGSGTWHDRLAPLWPAAEWTALEVWAPYVQRFGLAEKYDRVVVGHGQRIHLRKLRWQYDLAIFGDVIEHLDAPAAVEMVARLPWWRALVSVPLGEYPQGPWEGNWYEAHRSTWSVDGVLEAFPVMRHWTGSEIGVFLLDRAIGDADLHLQP